MEGQTRILGIFFREGRKKSLVLLPSYLPFASWLQLGRISDTDVKSVINFFISFLFQRPISICFSGYWCIEFRPVLLLFVSLFGIVVGVWEEICVGG